MAMMFTKRRTATTIALFTITVASSLIAVSGLVGFAFAATNQGKVSTTQISQKDLKASLSVYLVLQ